jgi:hypothetical protein
MSMPSTKSKMKYNRAAYRRYEFNLRMDSKLTAIIERYKSNPENHLSSLIKELLCRYWVFARHPATNSHSIRPTVRTTFGHRFASYSATDSHDIRP